MNRSIASLTASERKEIRSDYAGWNKPSPNFVPATFARITWLETDCDGTSNVPGIRLMFTCAECGQAHTEHTHAQVHCMIGDGFDCGCGASNVLSTLTEVTAR